MKHLTSKTEQYIIDQNVTFMVILVKHAVKAGRQEHDNTIVGRKDGRDTHSSIPTVSYANVREDVDGVFLIPHPDVLIGTGQTQECINELILSISSNIEIKEDYIFIPKGSV